MAEDQENRSREDLTEEASPHRIEEFRRKGQVPQSREISSLAALIAAGAVLYAAGPSMGAQLFDFMREIFTLNLGSKTELSQGDMVHTTLVKALRVIAVVGLPVAITGFFMGIFGSYLQIGSIFTFEPISPDLGKLNPLKGLQRLLSAKTAFDGVRIVFKAAAVMTVAYYTVRSESAQSPIALSHDPSVMLQELGRSGKSIFLGLCGVLIVFAGIDLVLQRFDYSKNTRMTKQEAKQEHKEREGDPQIRARIRSVQREMARKRMMAAVRKADVIITNPTHLAIAIQYDRESMAAPKVIAKGADFVAQKIKEIAYEAGIPTVENVPLARTLFKTVKVGQVVPRALYQAVAEVLAFVYRLKGRKG